MTRGKAPITQQIPDDSDSSYAAYKDAVQHAKADRKDPDAVKSALSGSKYDGAHLARTPAPRWTARYLPSASLGAQCRFGTKQELKAASTSRALSGHSPQAFVWHLPRLPAMLERCENSGGSAVTSCAAGMRSFSSTPLTAVGPMTV